MPAPARCAAAGLLGVVAAVGIGHSIVTRATGPVGAGAGTGAGTEPLAAVGVATGPTRLDLNTASEAELDLLPGIGPTLAARIVEARERRGGFASLEELDGVEGVGPATIERLRGLVEVRARIGARPGG